MIAYICGRIIVKQANNVIIESNGVGYELSVPISVIEGLVEGGDAALFVHHAVRDDGHFLYGFQSLIQRQLFRELLRVSGIGPKIALLILSGFSVESFARVVREGNTAALVKLPGVGKKTAERLLIELQDRIGKQFTTLEQSVASDASSVDNKTYQYGDARSETEEALVALGYKPAVASAMIDKALREFGADSQPTTDQLLRSVLRQQLPRS